LAPQFGNTLPAWWVVLDGKPVTRRAGENNWKTGIEPILEKLADAKLNGGGVVVHSAPSFPRLPVPESVADAESVPYLSGHGKESYRKFLASSMPRAFALSPDGAYSWRSGGTDPAKRAVDGCNAFAVDFPCKLYADGDKIVFKLD